MFIEDESISSGCVALAHKWMLSGKGDKKDLEGWSAGQICLFLDTIIASEKALPSDTVANIDHAYDVTYYHIYSLIDINKYPVNIIYKQRGEIQMVSDRN